MDINAWINSPKTVEKSKRSYAHFDLRTDISQQKDYIMSPSLVSKHGFYPFIHYQKNMTKYNAVKGKKPKVRDICYAAHIDRCIYQYYGFLLNEIYNQRVRSEQIQDVPVAYRTDLHKNNIHFAKRAFNFIKNQNSAVIMIGDFTKFFDKLDHGYLKQQWCSLLNVKQLPADHYAVFKNITKYSKWELSDILRINGLEDSLKGIRQLNERQRVLTKEQFQKGKSAICRNSDSLGIPQGSPISGLLANIYMMKVDKRINDMVLQKNGLYMRYSDDFIIVLPELKHSGAIWLIKEIITIFNATPGIELQIEKTQYFSFENRKICNCSNEIDGKADGRNQEVNFLGYSFDGNNIRIRAKTNSKYYYRMYRKARAISKSGGVTPKGNPISAHNLYKRYSIKGIKNGNYFSYVKRAQNVFGDEQGESIRRDTKRHMQKIAKAIKQQK